MEGLDLSDVFSNIPGHIYGKDLNGVYLFSNNSSVSKGELVGKTDEDCPWKEQAPQLRENDKKVMDTRQSLSFVEKAFLAENQLAYFYTVKSPLFDKKGKLIGIIGNSLNITSLISEP